MLPCYERRRQERLLVKTMAQRLYDRHGPLASDVVRSRLIHLAQKPGPPRIAKFWGQVHQRLKDMR